jgi:undecaprenyl pyrophosphate phosphatase UppP
MSLNMYFEIFCQVALLIFVVLQYFFLMSQIAHSNNNNNKDKTSQIIGSHIAIIITIILYWGAGALSHITEFLKGVL